MIHLKLCPQDQKEILGNLIQFYYYDLSSASKLIDIAFHDGRYQDMPYFENYWTEEQRYPYLIYKNDVAVGFALVHTLTVNEALDWKLAEFFVIKPFSDRGIGQNVFHQLLSLHPGSWEVSILKDNEPAISFWKKVLGKNGSPVKHNQFQNFIYYEIHGPGSQ
ncbi:GNAT family N-acetyltransferase [Legionella spiritensis]|uniref:GNAT family N-acetyltransferase n=1 Tax=Legionella spiritensis TaxID=452 RepID=UPI000F709F9F|nr:GNAT family N-acetyltransferase [Legionella spiritensis]VEG89597.1 N-acetyltransferase GCN5 [Legionella spiritensis]VEG92580.1 N-acetyltransferase GCN5 [Legionella spiritensis]